MNLIKNLLTKYRGLILYGIFGVLTTVVNIVTYFLCYRSLGLSNVAATALAWFLSVLFAFLTNKVWVFESKSFELKTLLYEMASFFSCRIATGLLDLGIMFYAVDCQHWNEMLWKILSNILVIVLNYIASKLFIFKTKA